MRRLATVLVVGLSLVVAQSQVSFARSSRDAGEGNCISWCYAHNSTENSQNRCILNCIDYYTPRGIVLGQAIKPVVPPRVRIGVNHAPIQIAPAGPGIVPNGHPGRARLGVHPLQ